MKFDHKFWLGNVTLPHHVELPEDFKGRYDTPGSNALYYRGNGKCSDKPFAAFYYRTSWGTYDNLLGLLNHRFGNVHANFGTKSWDDTYKDCLVLCYHDDDPQGFRYYLLADDLASATSFLKPLFEKYRLDHRGDDLADTLFGVTDPGTHKKKPVGEAWFRR